MSENTPSQSQAGRTEAFFSLAVQNRDAMRLLQNFGLLKGGAKHLDKGILQGRERSYRNIADHCLVVGMTTDILLEQAEQEGILSPQERKQGTKAAILHDVLKREELELKYGFNEDSRPRFIDPELEERVDEILLHAHHLSQSDLAAYSLTKLTGDGSFDLQAEDLDIAKTPQSFIQWTIFLADYMVAHDKIVSPQARIEEAMQRNEYGALESWWYKKLYGEEKYNEVVGKPNGNREIAEGVYIKAFEHIDQVDKQLHSLLKIPSEVSMVDFVTTQLQKRYQEKTTKPQI